MTLAAHNLLKEAERYGVQIVPTREGKLKAIAPKAPPSDLVARLKAHRAELLAELLHLSSIDQNERAAIIEHDGGVLRIWADGYARLCTMPCPITFTPKRWRQLVNDAGRFMDRWAEQVAALGWTTEEVFGVHPDAPDARQDFKGLVALIGGDEVVMVTMSQVRLRTRTGSTLTIYRSVDPPAATPVWQLGTIGGELSPRIGSHSD